MLSEIPFFVFSYFNIDIKTSAMFFFVVAILIHDSPSLCPTSWFLRTWAGSGSAWSVPRLIANQFVDTGQ